MSGFGFFFRAPGLQGGFIAIVLGLGVQKLGLRAFKSRVSR